MTTLDHPLVGKTVTYHGHNRYGTLGYGQAWEVVKGREDGKSVALKIGVDGDGEDILEWVGVNSLVEVESKTAAFLDPHAATLTDIDAQIKIHQDKINELRLARQVVAGL